MLPNATTSSMLRPVTNAERRKWHRFTPRRSLTAQIELASESMDAPVQNLSARGVALLSRCAFAAGTILKVQLVNGSATFSLLVATRVVHCNPVATGEYYLGCEFDHPLAPAEMGPFLV
jgi:hypothetical protein